MAISITKPVFGEQEFKAVSEVLASGWVTQGPAVAAFEKEFAVAVNAPFACAVSNCTTALHLALRAVGVQPGDEVITVSHTFIATANAIRYLGAVPVFVDVELQSFNMDAAAVEAAITEKTRAILCVHQLGMPVDLEKLLTISQAQAIPLIEDAACAVGSEILWKGQWERIGRPHGDIACFSFHPRKVLTTGDGGMITTANPEWDRQFRLWRQHGMDVPDLARHGSKKVIFESYSTMGYNYQMTDIQAAVGRVQLSRLPSLVQRRREIAAKYHDRLASISGIIPPVEPVWARTNWQSYCIRLEDATRQHLVMQFMLDHDIPTRRGVMCIHREFAYQNEQWRGESLTQSERAQESGIILPLYHEMTDAEIDLVVDTLKKAFQ